MEKKMSGHTGISRAPMRAQQPTLNQRKSSLDEDPWITVLFHV